MDFVAYHRQTTDAGKPRYAGFRYLSRLPSDRLAPRPNDARTTDTPPPRPTRGE